MTEQPIETGFDDIRRLFRENEEKLRRELQERDERLDRLWQETDERFQELEARWRETDERWRETDERSRRIDEKMAQVFAEIAQLSREADQRINRLETLFTGQWGKLMEALFSVGTLQSFQARGFDVDRLIKLERMSGGRHMEIDIVLVNDVVIAVEVKTTLKVDDVREVMEELARFEEFFPEYKEKPLYGAVAGLKIEEDSDRFAYQRGLFVLTLVGDDMIKILNDSKFLPKDFSQTPR